MPHIKNCLTSSEEELNEIFIETRVSGTPFKIGDQVCLLEDDINEMWTITDFTVTANDEPAALLENDTFNKLSCSLNNSMLSLAFSKALLF